MMRKFKNIKKICLLVFMLVLVCMNSSILAWNHMNRGAWWAVVHGVTELDTTEAT